MSTTYIDDSAFDWQGSWVHYAGSSGTQDATSWFNQTFSSHAYDDAVQIINATLAFTGTGAAFFSEFSTAQGRFFCRVDDQEYHWYNGGSAEGLSTWQLNTTRCAVSGLDQGSHTLTLGQTLQDGGNVGISLDYAVVENNGPSGTITWTSAFDTASPPANFADGAVHAETAATTSSSSTSVSSSSSSSTSSSFATLTRPTTTPFPTGTTTAPTSSPTEGASGGDTSSGSGGSSGTNTAALGAGLGAGLGGAALLVGVGFAWYRSRRNRGTSSVDGTSYAPTSYAPTSYSPSNAGGDPRMRSLSTATTMPGSPSDGSASAFVAPAGFNNFQRRASSTFPEVQDETHQSPVSPYESPYPSRQQDGSASPSLRVAPVPSSLADPQSFSPRY